MRVGFGGIVFHTVLKQATNRRKETKHAALEMERFTDTLELHRAIHSGVEKLAVQSAKCIVIIFLIRFVRGQWCHHNQ